MTLFVDASAMICMIAREAEARRLVEVLRTDPERLCSAMSNWETMAGLCRSYELPLSDAQVLVQRFVDEIGLRLVPIGQPECDAAAEAYRRYGKGRHSAALNMGDCFAYACAKANEARLLYIGDDFSRTDLG
ncbi:MULTISPECIES: type II toxin-antitoxin system VapC family toxin [unclassified Acidisoma]|jgi:ribonuclease VapC|uniref:type II toxin-antitoxin system VapC family toxin n=1 Tax=unclassified Acidisoma TaxID=2634065 RepID=UPI00131B3482|nr:MULTISPECIES: type II toxin-antitoxin system VapC family toxin [unclassified Acidisoma]